MFNFQKICLIFIFTAVKCENQNGFEIYNKIFNNGVLNELQNYYEQNNNQYNISECFQDIITWKKDFLKEYWSFQMYDSSGKLPSGILTLEVQNFGQFDECLAIDHFYENNRQIKGKYCLAKIPILPSKLFNSTYNEMMRIIHLRRALSKHHGPNSRLMNFDEYNRLSMAVAICMPHKCKGNEIQTALGNIIKITGISPPITIPESQCVTLEPTIWTPTDWGALAFFIFFGVLLILSTGYDIYIRFHSEKDVERKSYQDVLVSFSMWTNTSKIFTINKSSKNLKCLHGLRSLSLLWIIFSHRFLESFNSPKINNSYVFQWLEDYSSMIILTGTFAVDTFFTLGGLLVAYTSIKQLENGEFLDILRFYRHRYIRLTPAMAAVIVFQVSFFKNILNGPIWKTLIIDTVLRCEHSWWAALLYIQNYVEPMMMCLAHTWYLCCDMQLYIVSPIIIYPLLKWKRAGWINLLFWIIVSQIALFVITYENEWLAATSPLVEVPNRDLYIYIPTHARATPWLMGFAVGYFLHLSTKNQISININKMVVISGWIISLTILALIVFGMKPLQDINHKFNHAEDTMYNAFSRTAWSFAVLWIIVACIYGYGGPINWLLSFNMWEIMGKLSYSMFLIHGLVQSSISSTSRAPTYFSNYNTIVLYFGDILVTIPIAYLLTISFEFPFIALENILLKKRKINKSNPNKFLTTETDFER